MSLCRQCRVISSVTVRSDEEGHEVYVHNSVTFREAVADSCYFCTQVQTEMTEDVLELLDGPDFPGICCRICENRQRYGIDFSIPGKQQLAFFWLQEYADLGTTVFSERTDDESCWRRIENWYKTCRDTHAKCRSSSAGVPEGEKWLPTRLLDTNDVDSGSVRIVTTVDSKQFPPGHHTPPYLALSHCWGKRAFITLTQQNKTSLQTGFPLDSLPPNFRDAVRVTRRLGFRYVWIDSLCIIQGTDGDWADQAPLMDRVYMNAEICLAAAASEDAYGGFFRTRDPADLQPFRVDLQLVPPQHDGAAATSRPFYAYCGGQDPTLLWGASVERAPLNRRGWVQQERVLAPRTVHFGQAQVFWECRQLQACEAGPDSALAEFKEAMVKNWETKGPEAVGERAGGGGGGQLSPPPPSATDVYLAWRGIIATYSRCALTFEKDKLVAASGLAKAFARHLGDQYVAGLWRGHLVKEMLWSRARWNVDSRSTARRHAAYQAPTWSWASIDGPAEWGVQNRFEDCAEVVRVHVDPLTRDTTGGVRRAEIVLSGHLVPLARGAALRDFTRFIDVEGEDLAVAEDQVFLAPLCITVLGNIWKITWGLILTDAGAGHEGKYRRLGLFCGTSRSADEWYGTRGDAVRIAIV